MALCFADANDLALDPATTAEDTQHTLQSILSYAASVLCSLSVSPSVLLPHSFYLSLRSFALLSPLSSKFLISCLSVTKDAISLSLSLLPHTLSIPPIYISYLYLSTIPLSIIHSIHLNLFLPVSLFLSVSLPPIFPSLPPSFSLSLSLPSQQLHCPWVGVNNVSPHGAPVQSQPRRQGAPENTHNSMFQLGCGIKGSLTHGWLCGSALDHL